ncbi:tetratricopeptide repeat protein [Chitinophaga vietnamensis]|uniref:tetratricopeptide repeat protein n=1 Tax=Chitinophaga vietnamensis TaxID=2593957 RepID=UPI001178665F|nr:tetratricopeptide repeat protein [Chitinophaga vietnamensis]
MLNQRNLKSLLMAAGMLALLFSSSKIAAQQQRFDEANNLYRQSKFTEAAQIYQALIDSGYHEKALYLNAGNAWYKAGKNGNAIYNYEKALQLSPEDAAIKHNLAIANQKVNGFTDELPLVFFQRWWLSLQHLHRPNGWAAGAIIFFWLLIAGVLLNAYVPGWKNKYLRWGNYVLGILFALYLTMSIDTYLAVNSHHAGIVMNNNIKVKAAPDDNSKDMFELHEGMKVHIVDATRDFCKIEMPDGKNGWVSCSFIRVL